MESIKIYIKILLIVTSFAVYAHDEFDTHVAKAVFLKWHPKPEAIKSVEATNETQEESFEYEEDCV